MKINKFKLGIAMAAKGYNFTLLSQYSKVSRTTLSYINNGKSCRPEVLFKIARALDTDPRKLIMEECE